MTREEIEQLDDTEPYCFETDREEWWYNVGLKDGLETADQHPRKGLWDAQKVIEWLNSVDFSNYVENLSVVYVGQLKDDLIKAMED